MLAFCCVLNFQLLLIYGGRCSNIDPTRVSPQLFIFSRVDLSARLFRSCPLLLLSGMWWVVLRLDQRMADSYRAVFIRASARKKKASGRVLSNISWQTSRLAFCSQVNVNKVAKLKRSRLRKLLKEWICIFTGLFCLYRCAFVCQFITCSKIKVKGSGSVMCFHLASQLHFFQSRIRWAVDLLGLCFLPNPSFSVHLLVCHRSQPLLCCSY